VAASLLWATEAMPLFVTSLLVPLLIVVLRIPLDDHGVRMTAPEASKFIFSQMWSSVIMILLGGFTLAAALSKFQIAKIVATAMLSRAGSNPKIVLLVLMFVATFLSMWISNVAAPVLCFSIAQPLLRRLNRNDPFARAIILGIALASNIGGMVSPIASPQNIIALENMDPEPSWGQWFTVAIPVSILGLLLVWLFLILTFHSKSIGEITHVRQVEDKMTFTQWYICFVSVFTIALWCFSHQLEGTAGEMGVLAIVPIVLLFGPGLLTAADFNNFLWTIIALAMGGVALGKAVSSSGLLATIAHTIEYQIRGYSLSGVTCIFGLMILTVATFVSHTVAALIILPLVRSVGERLSEPHPRLLVMACALLCSAAMGLPTSGFPNVTAICMTDDLGKPYLTVGSFISRGVPSSLLVYAVIVTIGYSLMTSLGF
jgi:phosphate transporter